MKSFREIVGNDLQLEQVAFPAGQYRQEKHDKLQIVLHHTASGRGTDGDVRHWIGTKSRIATSIIIDYQGKVIQCFNSKYWAYHIGAGFKNNKIDSEYKKDQHWYDRHSIGIEIDAWGQLTEKGGKFYNWTGREVAPNRVVEYPSKFRGHQFFEIYTDAQVEATALMVKWYMYKYGIPGGFNMDAFDINSDALDKMPGIYTHNSYRSDKADIHPQTNLIAAIKSIHANGI